MTRTPFEEVQRLPVRWIGGTVVIAAMIAVSETVLGTPGAEVVLAVAAAVAAVVSFAAVGLTTRVRPDGVYVRFAPFHRSFERFSLDGIDRATARSHGPMLSVGKRGVRGRSKGLAYTITGDRVVVLHRPDREDVVVGTRYPEALVEAVEEAIDGTDDSD